MSTAPVMSINDELLAELEEAASNATPGPWYDDCCGSVEAGKKRRTVARFYQHTPGGTLHQGFQGCIPNAQHIAAANPATVLALIARIRELEKDSGRYRWLRDSGSPEIYLHNHPDVDNCKQIAGESLDSAIDAAGIRIKP